MLERSLVQSLSHERNKIWYLGVYANREYPPRMERIISVFDSARALGEIHALKPKVDFVIASYHGGDEYKDVPGESAEREMKLLADFGADFVFGHHPHVPNGIEVYHECWIFHSLGNAVFNQPQRFWTQRSFAALLQLEKRNGQKKISSIELIPFHPGYQPSTDLSKDEAQELMNRIQMLSTVLSHTHSEVTLLNRLLEKHLNSIFILSLFITLSTLIVGCGSEEATKQLSAEERYELGMKAFRSEDYLAAIEEFKVVSLQYLGSKVADSAQFYMAECRYLREEYYLPRLNTMSCCAQCHPASLYLVPVLDALRVSLSFRQILFWIKIIHGKRLMSTRPS